MLMLVVDTVMHLIVTWYMDAVFPGEFGVPQPYLFFLTKSYWSPLTHGSGHHNITQRASLTDFLETEPAGLKAGIEIRNLRVVIVLQLKGCPSSRVKQEVDTMVRETGLEAKRYALAGTLSGGQKRRLSVGIALINGSKVVKQLAHNSELGVVC
nr:hypothetical protein BaRGS_013655 [Batillaria attramentaria]